MIRNALAVLAAPIFLSSVLACSKREDMREVVTSEAMLRKRLANQSGLPTFDETALGMQSCGLVVLEVAVRNDGKLIYANVLEAPTAAIGERIRIAVSQWRFKPIVDEQGFVLKTKLSFYLIKEQSVITTFNPEDVGFIGACRSPSTI